YSSSSSSLSLHDALPILLVLGDGIVHPRAVPLLPHHAQRGFDHRAEHQPVGGRRPDPMRRVERGDHIALRLTIEPLPQLDGETQDRKSTRLNSSHEWISY